MCFEFLTISSTQSARNSQRNQKRSKMQAVKGFFSSIKAGFASKGRTMGIVLGLLNPELSDFQNKKLLHEFHVFFDLNKDGILEWKDFDIARKKICELSGWKVGSEKYQQTNELFITIWRKLQDDGDENNDGKISTDEWLKMWSQFNEQCIKQSKKENEEAPERKLPDWLQQYIDYKFNLYDRTGDGHIDAEEFEYVLSDFGVSAKEARNSFLMFSCNNTKKVDRDYFKELCIDYYRSDDPSALGNFISGKLDFND